MPRAIGHLTVAAVGRLREPHWQAAQDEYARRLRRYTDFQLVEVKDVVGRALPDTAAAAREGEALPAAAPRGARLVLMTAGGRQHSSPGTGRLAANATGAGRHAGFPHRRPRRLRPGHHCRRPPSSLPSPV